MKIEEALNVWIPVVRMSIERYPNCREALDMAIRSLEAWEKVIKELDSMKEYEEGCYCALGVINKEFAKIEVQDEN